MARRLLVRGEKRSAFLLLSAFLAFSFTGCSLAIRGQFGWSSTDDRGLVEPEKSLLMESEFKLTRQNLYFYDYETIWWIYRIEGGLYDKTAFLAALYENNVAPEPVEIDLRPVSLQKTGESSFIRQYYDPLKPGNYILKIAHKSVVIDQVEFHIVPPGGPRDLGAEEEENLEETEPDEIIRYSSVLERNRAY